MHSNYISAWLTANIHIDDCTVRDTKFRASFFCHFKKLWCKSLFIVNVTFKHQILKFIFCSHQCMSIIEVNNVKPILHFLTVYWQWCPKFRVSNCTFLKTCQFYQIYPIFQSGGPRMSNYTYSNFFFFKI
jgi:hypothetical protein